MATSHLSERPNIEPRWLMPALDVLLIGLAFGLAYILRYDWQLIRPILDPSRADFAPYIPYALAYAALLLLFYYGNGLYRNIRGRGWVEEVGIISNGAMVGTVLLLAAFFLLQPLTNSRLMLIYMVVLTIALLSFTRALRRIYTARLRGQGIGVERVLLVGMGEVGQAVLRIMVSRGELGYKVVGFLDDDPYRNSTDYGRVQALGRIDNLRAAIKGSTADLVVITLRWAEHERIMALSKICREMGVQVRVVPDIFQLNMRQVQVESLDGIPLLGINDDAVFQGSSRFYKRVLDLSITFLAAPVWLLVMGVIALAIRLTDRGPIFYAQTRIGEGGKPFRMMKFRSMIPNADKLQAEIIAQAHQDPRHPKLVNDPRVTSIGRILRKTSLDELPNLFNVLRGEMSLVGPRPPTPDEVALYEKWHLQRLQIMPGMTGLWQISGRSDVPFDEMCLMDIYYIENWSIKFDVQILLLTVPKVLMRRGAY